MNMNNIVPKPSKKESSMNWRKQRDKYGKIYKNQLWQKIHDGVIIKIHAKKGGQWRVHYQNRGGSGKSHVIEERMIYHYFNLLE